MSIEGFVPVARRFVEFVDSSHGLSAGDFLRSLQPLLVNLYGSGLALDSGEPDDTADVPDSLTADDWQALYRRLGAQLRGYDDYAFVFEPQELSATPVVGSLSDDVADIYLELRNGFTLFDEGKPAQAIWEWRFGFDNHWGRHAAHAIYALHTLQVATVRWLPQASFLNTGPGDDLRSRASESASHEDRPVVPEQAGRSLVRVDTPCRWKEWVGTSEAHDWFAATRRRVRTSRVSRS